MFLNIQHPGEASESGGSAWPGLDGIDVPRVGHRRDPRTMAARPGPDRQRRRAGPGAQPGSAVPPSGTTQVTVSSSPKSDEGTVTFSTVEAGSSRKSVGH